MFTNTMADFHSSLAIPKGYKRFLEEIKEKIQKAQVRASLSVNKELVLLYWSIGQSILDKQVKEGWGSKIIDRMSKDLSSAFPGVSGFSVRNLKKICRVVPLSSICADAACTITLVA